MKRWVLSLSVMLGLLGLAVVPAAADTLDDYLVPGCGYHDEGPGAFQNNLDTWVNDLQVRFGDEIVARASNFDSMDASIENRQLLWLVGTMNSPEAREIAAAVVAEGAPKFRAKVMGGIGFMPDWGGVEILIDGCNDSDIVVRDSAVTILTTNIDFAAPAFSTADAPQRFAELSASLMELASNEDDPRLRGMLQAQSNDLSAAMAGN